MNLRKMSSSYSGSSTSINDFNQTSIIWYQEGKRLRDLMAVDFRTSANKSFIVRSQCRNIACECALREHKALVVKPEYDLTFISGTWLKQKTVLDWKTNSPIAESHANLLISSKYDGLFEILNENLQPIPIWTSMKEVIQVKPSSFVLRKDIKGHLQRTPTASKKDLFSSHTTILKAGTILNFVECRTYKISKSRSKTKDVPMVQCIETKSQRSIYISPDERGLFSPIDRNISGVHHIHSLARNFHFPINLHPVFQAPLSSLALSDRHFFRAKDSYRGDILLIAPIDNLGRIYVITASMFEDHLFYIGEATQPNQFKALDKHTEKAKTFISSSHHLETLKYLVRHLRRTTNMSYGPVGAGMDTMQRNGSVVTNLGNNRQFDLTYQEIDDIYVFIRTGRYPKRNNSQSSTNSQTKPSYQYADILATSASSANGVMQQHSTTNNKDGDDIKYRCSSFDNILETSENSSSTSSYSSTSSTTDTTDRKARDDDMDDMKAEIHGNVVRRPAPTMRAPKQGPRNLGRTISGSSFARRYSDNYIPIKFHKKSSLFRSAENLNAN